METLSNPEEIRNISKYWLEAYLDNIHVAMHPEEFVTFEGDPQLEYGQSMPVQKIQEILWNNLHSHIRNFTTSLLPGESGHARIPPELLKQQASFWFEKAYNDPYIDYLDPIILEHKPNPFNNKDVLDWYARHPNCNDHPGKKRVYSKRIP